MKHGECSVFSKKACDWVKTPFLKSGWWLLLFYQPVFDFWWCSCMLQLVVLYYPHLAALWGCVFERIHSCQTKRWELHQNCQLYSPPLSVYPCAVQTCNFDSSEFHKCTQGNRLYCIVSQYFIYNSNLSTTMCTSSSRDKTIKVITPGQ